MHPKNQPPVHLPQLDGLRTFAVLAVWMTHWGVAGLPVFECVPWGPLGVQLFFVLSGFLITGILLRSKSKIEQGTIKFWSATGNFFARRSLRIFPIYYLCLATLSVLGNAQVLEAIGWHLSYTSNFFFAARGRLDIAGAHLWTLSVEEQYYLFWPFVVLCIPTRFLLLTFSLVIMTATAFRLVCWLNGYNGLGTYVLLPACLDYFGWGGLVAVLSYLRKDRTKAILFSVGFWFAFPIAVAILAYNAFSQFPSEVGRFAMPIAICVFFSALVGRSAIGFRGPAGLVLEAKPIVYLGKISYGLYLYHGFVPAITFAIGRRLGYLPSEDVWLRFGLFSGITIAISAVSWTLVEKPILRLKDYFRDATNQNPSFIAASL